MLSIVVIKKIKIKMFVAYFRIYLQDFNKLQNLKSIVTVHLSLVLHTFISIAPKSYPDFSNDET